MVVYSSDEKTKISSAAPADADNVEIDPYAILRAKVPELRNLTKESFPNYTSLIAAQCRGLDYKRPDRIVNDQFAEDLAGEVAKAFMEFFASSLDSQEVLTYASLRHRMIDDEIEENLPADIHQVVVIGSGMDSRSYRLQRLANCHVFELDGCAELAEHKQRVLKKLDAKLLAQRHDVIITDLAEEKWPNELMENGFDPSKPTLWIVEALLEYLDEPAVDRLMTVIDGISAPGSVALVEMCGTGAINMDIVLDDNDAVAWNIGSQEKHHQGGVLRALPWSVDMVVHRTSDAKYSGRRWDAVKFARAKMTKEQATLGPWFVAACTKPSP